MTALVPQRREIAPADGLQLAVDVCQAYGYRMADLLAQLADQLDAIAEGLRDPDGRA